MSQQPTDNRVPSVAQRVVTVYTKAPKFFIDATDQYGNVERHTARGHRVAEYGQFVAVFDHESTTVLAVKLSDVVAFGKV